MTGINYFTEVIPTSLRRRMYTSVLLLTLLAFGLLQGGCAALGGANGAAEDEADPAAAEAAQQDEADPNGSSESALIEAELNQLFSDATLEETFEGFYRTVSNYMMGYYVMAQRAFADNKLPLALHLAERSAELEPTEEIFLLKAYLHTFAGDTPSAVQALWNARQFSEEMRDLYDEVGFMMELRVMETQPEVMDRVIPPYVSEISDTVGFPELEPGYFVAVGSFVSESRAQQTFTDIFNYYYLAFREGFPGHSIMRYNNALSVFFGPYESAEAATVAQSRLIIAYPAAKLVQNQHP
ncbi:hypothetical protein CYPRO_2782 [Cyclonatronum proteinivorum]|uniref:SPOR domain-containing protein n=1 Tax=Cyclonatronum proteinivorum TaxID=1457365 RepID=A0A345UNG9_9BACT|nr:hypothetical protein [Cyclonatronum proteinivorum]AXJ02021.1 hypothetical protein CYPRO_2782 [Cyclonatronum proteinivorum]